MNSHAGVPPLGGGMSGMVPAETRSAKMPHRAPTVGSEYMVPLLISITIGGLAAWFLVTVYKHITFLEDPEIGYWMLWLEMFLPITIISFILILAGAWKLLWTAAEIITNQDLDNDGFLGNRPIINARRGDYRPGPPKKVNVKQATDPTAQPLDDKDFEKIEEWTPELVARGFPMQAGESAIAWFVRCADTVGTGSRLWERLLGRKRYTDFRDSLIQAGWANWNSYNDEGEPNTRTGWTLTAESDEIVRKIDNE